MVGQLRVTGKLVTLKTDFLQQKLFRKILSDIDDLPHKIDEVKWSYSIFSFVHEFQSLRYIDL